MNLEESIKAIMYANDVDCEMSLEDDSIKYIKSYQLYGKIKEIISKLLLAERERIVGEIEKEKLDCMDTSDQSKWGKDYKATDQNLTAAFNLALIKAKEIISKENNLI